MRKNIEVFLLHMLDAIQRIDTYTGELSEDQFYANKLVQDGVVRNLEIIGEAAKCTGKVSPQSHRGHRDSNLFHCDQETAMKTCLSPDGEPSYMPGGPDE